MAFDIGCLLGNLMLAVLSLMGMDRLEQEQQLQQQQQQQAAHTEQFLQELPKVAQQQQQQRQQLEEEAIVQQSFCTQHQHSRKQQAKWLLEVRTMLATRN